jgi:hypothetical protein
MGPLYSFLLSHDFRSCADFGLERDSRKSDEIAAASLLFFIFSFIGSVPPLKVE